MSLRIADHRRTVQLTALISGILLIAMGVVAAVLAFTGTAMSPGGWQTRLSARLQHYAAVVLSWVDSVPGWIVLAAVVAAVALLARRAVRQHLDEFDTELGDSGAVARDTAVPVSEHVSVAEIAGSEGEP